MKILCYTRIPQEDEIYAGKLAYSMHLALQEEDGRIVPLNHNSGILYARATQNADGTLNAKCLTNPWLFAMRDETFAVIARRTGPDGKADASAAGKLLFFTSGDLIHFREHPLLDLHREHPLLNNQPGEHPQLGDGEILDVLCRYDEEKNAYLLMWKEKGGRTFRMEVEDLESAAGEAVKGRVEEVQEADFDREAVLRLELPAGGALPEGAVLRNALEISGELACRLRTRFLTPVNISNEAPERVCVSSPTELEQVKALARYSDGSSVEKRVDWYDEEINWNTPGEYEAQGRVHQDRYEFPAAWHKADPCIGRWQGKYYFISTNDLDHEHTIYIRQADTIAGLVTAQQVRILDAYTYPHLGNLLWAPELHVIGDRLCVLHAGTPQAFEEEQCHIMMLKKGGNPMKASDWEKPRRIRKKDGSWLYDKAGITLDMTYFEAGGAHYVCWSQRQFHPVDQGAWLYIARIDPAQPDHLITDPQVLALPEYGWENNHTFVVEGPFALRRDGKVYLTYSAAAVDSTYTVGLLTAQERDDLLNSESWVKENCPLLSSRSVPGEYGTGYNAYVTDEDGLVFNAYHARPGVRGPRCTGIRRVHFNAEGFPVLDLTQEKDLVPQLAPVKTLVCVPER